MGIINFKCEKCRKVFTKGPHKVEVVKFKKSDKHKTETDMGVCPDCGELMEICTRLR